MRDCVVGDCGVCVNVLLSEVELVGLIVGCTPGDRR